MTNSFARVTFLVGLSEDVPSYPDGPPHGGPAECTQVCTKELQPVCAVDEQGREKTFPSKCMIGYLNCKGRTSEYERQANQVAVVAFTEKKTVVVVNLR